MIVFSKERIIFFDKLKKTLKCWHVNEDEANEFIYQVAEANISDDLIFDGIKYNLFRWQVSEDDANEFISQFKDKLEDDIELSENMKDVQATVFMTNGWAINFYMS